MNPDNLLVEEECHQEVCIGICGGEGVPEDELNRLYICTGILKFTLTGGPSPYTVGLKGESEDKWTEYHLSWLVGPSFGESQRLQFVRAIGTASLARTYNAGTWHYGGWRVNSVDAHLNDDNNKVELTLDLAVRDTDGYLEAITYQVFILAYDPANR
jgi:hypothetical protein